MGCHNPHDSGATSPKVNKSIVDSSIDTLSQNLIITPEEWQEDSVFKDGSKPAPWSVAGINDANQLKIFIKFLRLWVEKGNKDSIAAHIQYPLSNFKSISSPALFIRNYDTLFNAKVLKALANQKLSQIFRNRQGAMIGNGELWIRNIAPGLTDVFKITTINN